MTYNYVVSAHKQNSVHIALRGAFTGRDVTNVILVKGLRFEVLELAPEGLKPVAEYPVYGRIAFAALYRPEGRTTDLLFLTTERFQYAVVRYDAATGRLITEAIGDLTEPCGRPAEQGQRGGIDPNLACIGLLVFEGRFHVLPLETQLPQRRRSMASRRYADKDLGRALQIGDIKEAYQVDLPEYQISAVEFLYGYPKPTVAVLHETCEEERLLSAYTLNLAEKKLVPHVHFYNIKPDDEAHMIIPVPLPHGGLLVAGERSISYYMAAPNPRPVTVLYEDAGGPADTFVVQAHCRLDSDGRRFLIGNHLGGLYLLELLLGPREEVVALNLRHLGQTSVARSMVYLDDGFTYIGSHFGDSVLIRLRADSDDGGYFDVIETFTNLSPIVDFCVVDFERQGQGRLVTCSGGWTDGSLRIVRNGIGINELAVLEMEGIQSIWSIRRTFSATYVDALVVSFISETHVFTVNENGEMHDAFVEGHGQPGFSRSDATLRAGNAFCDGAVNGGSFVYQVTNKSYRLIDWGSPPGQPQLVDEWTPPNGTVISVASANPTQAVLALTGGILVYLEVDGRTVREISQTKMKYEISSLDITPFQDSTPCYSRFCAVGLWTDVSVNLLEVPSLRLASRNVLDGGIIPRSLLMANFEGVPYLLAATGDGYLYDLSLDVQTGQVNDRKKLPLGTRSVTLTPFDTTGGRHVFAASDRPTVIHSNNKKLLYSNVNLKEATHVCQFNARAFPKALAIATSEGLTIGTADGIQKLHVRTVPIGELPRRIAHVESHRVFAIVTQRHSTGGGDGVSHLRLRDDQNFDEVDSYAFKEMESTQALAAVQLGKEKPTEFLAAGTAVVEKTSEESSDGWIYLFEINECRKLRQVWQKKVNGAVFSVAAFNGMLMAACNNRVNLYEWRPSQMGSPNLSIHCTITTKVLALSTVTIGDFIIVGDLMNSVTVLLYRAMDESLEEIARDYNCNWTTTVEAIDQDNYIVGEHSGNLYTLRRNTDCPNEDDLRRLEHTGRFRLDDSINRFRHGCLVMVGPEMENTAKPSLIFGTVNGLIGVVAQISKTKYEFLNRVQESMREITKGIGIFDHAEYRMYATDLRAEPSENFLDGDLIEMYLELDPEDQDRVAKSVDCTTQNLTRVIEDISRVH